MRIACDVMGTIDGPKKESVIHLIKRLVSDGHEVVVWSSEWSMAKDAVEKHKLVNSDGTPLKFQVKFSQFDAREQESPLFDLALEDDYNQTRYLAAKRFLMVDRIPYNLDRADQVLLGILEEIGLEKMDKEVDAELIDKLRPENYED